MIRSLRGLAHSYACFRLAAAQLPEREALAACRRERLATFTRCGELWVRGFRLERGPVEERAR